MNYGEPKLICPLIAAELFHARGTCESTDRAPGDAERGGKATEPAFPGRCFALTASAARLPGRFRKKRYRGLIRLVVPRSTRSSLGVVVQFVTRPAAGVRNSFSTEPAEKDGACAFRG